jgi:hypothetical protein
MAKSLVRTASAQVDVLRRMRRTESILREIILVVGVPAKCVAEDFLCLAKSYPQQSALVVQSQSHNTSCRIQSLGSFCEYFVLLALSQEVYDRYQHLLCELQNFSPIMLQAKHKLEHRKLRKSQRKQLGSFALTNATL